MAYLKDELSGFIPEEISADIIRKVTRGSSIMRLSRIESMKSDKLWQGGFSINSALPLLSTSVAIAKCSSHVAERC